MTKVLIAIFLLLAPDSGQVCAAAAACAWNSSCHAIDASHHHSSGPHHSTPCEIGTCRLHDVRLFALPAPPDARIDGTLSGKSRVIASHLIPQPVDVPAGSVPQFALLLPHPFPEATLPAFLVHCAILC
ncbi:MAG: hypothetical protein U5R30_20930 [Deltaproteobacteria bacterium]|nr:hypothetical protein [Deltaproteobacteria bacterium]